MNAIHISLFGSLAVTLAEQPLGDLGTDKVRALLGYLALEAERDHARRQLAGLLWPSVSDKQARQSLRDALYRLRQSLDRLEAELTPPIRVSAELLTVGHQMVTLQTNSPLLEVRIDVAQFRAHLATIENHPHAALAECDECLTALEAAVALYQGELLAGFGLADAPDFEEWLLLQREMLHQQALLAFGRLASVYEERGAYEQAADYAGRLQALDPYRETSQRLVMRLLALRGLPDQALAQFSSFRQLMMDGFGAEPEAETVALVERIRRGELKHDKMTQPVLSLPKGWQDEKVADSSAAPFIPPTGHPVTNRHDWREMPTGSPFFGREEEVKQVEEWLVIERCRLVSILAIGGMGKTSLAAQVVPTIAEHFDLVIWRSLLNAPPLEELLSTILPILSNQQLGNLPKRLGPQLQLLFNHLHKQRVLLILDNLESILQADAAGQYRAGYEQYEQLLYGMATQQHQGQLLLTSREQPMGIKPLERDTPQVRSLQLSGLSPAASEQLLVSRWLPGNSHDEAMLADRYSGNPLALKLVADTVQDLFLGDVQEFLAEDSLIFDDVRHVLDQQFERAPQLEREILLWLAVERLPMSVADIRTNLLHQPPQRGLLEALQHLQRRSLIERDEAGFGLQNVIIEYLTDLLIDHAHTEIISGKLDIINRHALLLARSVEYVRQSQSRLILQPLGKRLCSTLGSTEAILKKVNGLLQQIRGASNTTNGYAAGNLLNLLLALELDVRSCDFSNLCVRQAFLQDTRLGNVNFDGADLAGSVFNDAFGVVQALALHPDGNTLAVASLNEGVRLWHLDDWQLQAILSNDGIRVASIAFSPDGSVIVGASDDNTVRIWQTDTGKLLHSLAGHTDALWSVAVAPDGKYIASASDDQTVRLWNAQTGQLLTTIQQHTDVPKAVAFSPDSTLLASTGSDNTLRLWDIHAQEERAVIQSANKLSTALAFSLDGQTIAIGDHDGKVTLWNVATAQMEKTFEGHLGWVNDIAFSPDGHSLASTCNDQTVRIWDTQSGETRHILRHSFWVWDLAFSADGNRLVTSCNNMVAVWNARTGQLQNSLRGHSGYAKSLLFSRDGSTLTAGIADGTVHRWQTTRNKPQYLPTAGKPIWQDFGVLSPDGQHIASGCNDNESIQILDIHSGLPQIMMQGDYGRIQAGAFSANGKLLTTVTLDRTLQLWDTQDGRLLASHHIPGENQFVYQIALSPDARMVAIAGADHLVYVWLPCTSENKQTHQEMVRLAGHSRDVYAVAFCPASDDDTEHGGAEHSISEHSISEHSISEHSISERGTQLLATCSSDRTVRLWTLANLAELSHDHEIPCRILEGHTTWVWSVAFSPDGTILASGSEDGVVILWDVTTGAIRHTLNAHTGWVPAFAFTPDGRIVASSGGDETIKFWDVQTGACLQTLRIPGPYEGMSISGVTGISDAQKAALVALGAVER